MSIEREGQISSLGSKERPATVPVPTSKRSRSSKSGRQALSHLWGLQLRVWGRPLHCCSSQLGRCIAALLRPIQLSVPPGVVWQLLQLLRLPPLLLLLLLPDLLLLVRLLVLPHRLLVLPHRVRLLLLLLHRRLPLWLLPLLGLGLPLLLRLHLLLLRLLPIMSLMPVTITVMVAAVPLLLLLPLLVSPVQVRLLLVPLHKLLLPVVVRPACREWAGVGLAPSRPAAAPAAAAVLLLLLVLYLLLLLRRRQLLLGWRLQVWRAAWLVCVNVWCALPLALLPFCRRLVPIASWLGRRLWRAVHLKLFQQLV